MDHHSLFTSLHFTFHFHFTTSRYAPSQQGVEVGIEARLKEAWAQNVQDQALLEALAQNVQDQAILEALAPNGQDYFGPFRDFGTICARLDTFSGFDTERARQALLEALAQNVQDQALLEAF